MAVIFFKPELLLILQWYNQDTDGLYKAVKSAIMESEVILPQFLVSPFQIGDYSIFWLLMDNLYLFIVSPLSSSLPFPLSKQVNLDVQLYLRCAA